MPNDSEPKTLIADLTQPLKQPEEREQAQRHLEGFLSDEALPVRKRSRIPWAAIIWALALVCLFVDMRLAYQEKQVARIINRMGVGAEEIPPLKTGPLTDHQELVLAPQGLAHGNPKEQLHLNHPQHPGYFAQYVDESYSERRALPDEFMEKAKRIDPENAYFPLLMAAQLVGDSIEAEKLLADDWEWKDEQGNRKRNPPQRYEVSDQEALDEALAMVRQACELPRLQTYYTDRQQEVAVILDQVGRDDTLPGLLRSVMVWIDAGISPLQLKRSQNVISAAAYQAFVNQDKERLLEMIELREKLVRLLGNSEDRTLINSLIYQAVAMATANDFEHYCKELGLTELEAKFRQQGEALHQRRQDAKKNPNNDFLAAELHRRAGVLQGLMLPVVTAQAVELPALDDKDLRPLREAEHDFGTRMGLRGHVLISLVMAGLLWLCGRCLSKGIKQPARQAARCLRTTDWLVATGLGLALPVALHWLLTRYTPLGGRDFGVSYFGFLYPVLPLSCLLAVMLLTTAHLLRGRLEKRLPFKNAEPSRRWLSRCAIAIVLAALPLAYVLLQVVYDNDWWRLNEVVCYALMALPGIALLAVGILGLWRGLRGQPEQRFMTAATCLCMARCLPVAIIACLISASVFRASEIHWIRQEPTLRLSAKPPDFGIYEMMVARQVYKEVNAIVLPDGE